MDLFSRKKKRQPTDPADRSVPYERTSTGRNPVNVDTVSASRISGAAAINSNSHGNSAMYISNPHGNPALGMGVAGGRDRYVSSQFKDTEHSSQWELGRGTDEID